ncbi:exodeoxyribonuclease VII small subunit [bacterium D16-54]|nr:exodeoxyribonuclease VII small subunit [bacterium D16-54]RKJ15177.1 exodeoxyribonuclease VII small subunit [bacterium D16-56]
MDKSIEEIFEELDQIMEKMEAADTSLEDSFTFYEAGMKLVRACGEKIDKVEKKIMVLQGGQEIDGDV